MLFILSGASALVLLVACANLASLLLARGVAREREVAVRRAMGAGRLRLARHLLTEGLVLSAAGGLAGLLLAAWSRDVLSTMLTSAFGASMLGSLALDVRVDGGTLALTAGAAALTTLVIGLVPALRLARVDPTTALKHQVVGAARPKLTVGRVLTALQIAVSLPLIAAAALLLRSTANLAAVEIGFDPRDLVVFQLDPAMSTRPPGQRARVYPDVLAAIAALPGVRSATLIENPFLSGITSSTRAGIDGETHPVLVNAVGPDFVETMGMRLVGGRALTLQDDESAPPVGLVNEAAVRLLFGGASPIGRQLALGGRRMEVVGVVGDTRYRDRRGTNEPIVFPSALQRGGYRGHRVVVRTSLRTDAIAGPIQRAVAGIDRGLPVPDVRMHAELRDQADLRARVFTQLLGAFSLFALLLATIGVYGVTAYSVARRTSEIGLRVALGATPRQMMWLIVRDVAMLASCGAIAGVPLALAVTPLLASLLFDVAPGDPATVAAAAGAMLAVALAAGVLPARRASALDPLTALRTE
jgi:predicted permease